MASRLPTFESQVGLTDVSITAPNLESVGSAAGAFRQLSGSLLDRVIKERADDAEQRALENAGQADIVKGPDGVFMRPAPPEGGGKIYMDVWNKVVDARLTDKTSRAFELGLNQMSADLFDDPEAFLANAEGVAEGILSQVDPRVRPAVEANFIREISERGRGLVDAKRRNDFAVEVGGIEQRIAANQQAMSQIITLGGPDAAQRAEVVAKQINDDLDLLGEMGQLDARGMEAARTKWGIGLRDDLDFRLSTDNKARVGPIMMGIDDEGLARISLFGRGMTDGGTVKGPFGPKGEEIEVDLDQYQALFPDKSIALQVGSAANDALGKRLQEQAAIADAEHKAAMLAATQASAATAQETLTAIRANNYDAAGGLDKNQVAAISQAYDAVGSVHSQMSTPDGRARTLSFIGQYGVVPPQLVEYLDGNVAGNALDQVSSFAIALRETTVGGRQIGEQLYQSLKPQTRALLDYNATLQRAGMPAEARVQMVEDRMRGKLPTLATVQGEMPTVNGRKADYASVRRAAIAKAVGVTEQQVGRTPTIGKDFDALMQTNYQLYGSWNRALDATAAQVARNWVPSAVFLGGIGPRELVTAGVTKADLDRRIASASGANPQGARFANAGKPGLPYAQLQPIVDTPAKGLGLYSVLYFNKHGQPIGSEVVNLDDALKGVSTEAAKRVGAARVKKLQDARADAARKAEEARLARRAAALGAGQ